MRYEAKHSYFKKLTQSIGNFTNLSYTLAMRHQQLQCYLNVNTNDMPGWNNMDGITMLKLEKVTHVMGVSY